MREILFRGKRTDNGEWIYGAFTKDVYAVIIPGENGTNVLIDLKSVDPSTIGQYTGLTDKNGVKIFEGDIFCHPSNLKSIYIVSWDEHGGFTIFTADAGFNPKSIEIIGNIYDNPELLKEA